MFGNNKPWINKELKTLIIKKRNAFKNQNKDKVKEIQKEINAKIKECKYDYKNKIEEKFRSSDSKGMWAGLKTMAGFTSKQPSISVDKGKEQQYAEELNTFYARFDCHDFKDKVKNIKSDLNNSTNESPTIYEHDVLNVFTSLKPNKACGPDGLKGKLLKTFAT